MKKTKSIPKWSMTYEEMEHKYNVKVPTLKVWSRAGVNLDDEKEVEERKQSSDLGPAIPKTKIKRPALNFSREVGLRQEASRLKTASMESAQAYEDAVKSGDEYFISKRKNDWIQLAEQLRKIEHDIVEIEQQNNQSINLMELEKVLGEICGNIRTDLENLPKQISKALVGKPEKEIETIITNEMRIIMEKFYHCDFMKND